MTESKLEIPHGDLESLVPQFVTGTVQTSAEIQRARLNNWLLKNLHFYTANFGLYDLEKDAAVGVHDADGEAVLYFGRRENNPIFNNLAEACFHLTTYNIYAPSPEAVRAAKSSALRVKLANLKLQRFNVHSSYYNIELSDYDSLNQAQRALAEAVHGEGQQFTNVMNMLCDAGVERTRIYVLNPKYIEKFAKEQAICMASKLDYIVDNTNFLFDAGYYYVNFSFHMRGKLKNSTT